MNVFASDEFFWHFSFHCYTLQIHVTFNPAGSYAVENLKPDTLYYFSLAARSEMGLGVYTQPIEARTAQSSKYTFVCLEAVPVLFLSTFYYTNQWFQSHPQPAAAGLGCSVQCERVTERVRQK